MVDGEDENKDWKIKDKGEKRCVFLDIMKNKYILEQYGGESDRTVNSVIWNWHHFYLLCIQVPEYFQRLQIKSEVRQIVNHIWSQMLNFCLVIL